MRYDEGVPAIEAVQDRDVYVLDFSFKRGACRVINTLANKLVILDHHKTAQAELEGLKFAQFDMNRSGAMMTWGHFAGKLSATVKLGLSKEERRWRREDLEPPWVVQYVQDRDLWRHELSCSREVNSYIATLPHTFVAWDKLETEGVECAIGAGVGARAYVQMLVRRATEAGFTVASWGKLPWLAKSDLTE